MGERNEPEITDDYADKLRWKLSILQTVPKDEGFDCSPLYIGKADLTEETDLSKRLLSAIFHDVGSCGD